MLMKGKIPGHKSARPDVYKTEKFLDEVSWDFVGQYPESHAGNKWALNGIDEYTSWPFCYPCKAKSDCGQKLKRFFTEVGVCKRCHADNAAEFKGDRCEWRLVCAAQHPPALVDFSAPWTPQQNGKIERWNQTSQNAVRCIMFGVDPKFWDYAYKYVCYVFARIARKAGKPSPFFKRFGREASVKHLRRFGCLAYARQFGEDAKGKLTAKYRRGIFLGCGHENSTYLVGLWKKDNRCADGIRFAVDEVRACAFDESTLIRDVEDLKQFPKGTFVPFALPSTLSDSVVDPSLVAFPGVALPEEIAPDGGEGSGPETGDDFVVEEADDAGCNGVPLSLADLVESGQPGQVVTRRKRGRKPGTKALPHWKKPGRKPRPKAVANRVQPWAGTMTVAMAVGLLCNPAAKRKRRSDLEVARGPSLTSGASGGATEAMPDAKRQKVGEADQALTVHADEVAQGIAFGAAAFDACAEDDPELRDAVASYAAALDDETAIEFQVMVSRKEAFNGPDADKWIEADTLERTRLEAHKCWRPLQDGEYDPSKDEVIPAVCIYSRKRCGRYKCRLVALGNRQKQIFGHEIYSPTISGGGNRFILVESAAQGHFLRQFDAQNAFIQAALTDERVIVRLPEHWSSSGDGRGDLVMLLKSLYGLRIAPRKWYDCYRSGLESLGWEMCPREPGLFRKNTPSGRILCAIFVDDSLLSGPCQKTLDEEMAKILKVFPGTVIPPEMEGNTEVRDVLGMCVKYNREERWVKMSIAQAVDKMLKKFNVVDCKPVSTPCVAGDLTQGEKATNFPLRSLVGGLQYVGHQVRPDIVFAIQRVARCQEDPTVAAVKAGKRILAYLKGTREQGLEYSPELEKRFAATYGKIAEEAGKKLPHTVAYSDSDFAGCTATLRSTSGSILYHRGVPIVWSCKKQSVKALSTCEAEYVAAFDTIRLSLGQGYLDWFMCERALPLTFVDNRSALDLSRSSIVTKRSKHIHLRFHVVRDHAQDLCWVPTDFNKADPLTKALPASAYLRFFHPDGEVPAEDTDAAEAEDDDDFDNEPDPSLFARNIRHRGNVQQSDREKSKAGFRVGPLVLAFFLFVVVGSAILQIISASQKGLPPA
eukprot:g3656.t1